MTVNIFGWRSVGFIIVFYLVKMVWVCHLA